MKIGFRQGIIRHQTDISNNPTFLQYSGGTVNIIVSPTPTVIAFAHGFNDDYVFEESTSVTGAWSGPFTPGTDYWLYWDIDIFTGLRTYGHTTVEPIDGSIEPQKVNDQNWFDITTSTSKVVVNGRWTEKVRCFAGKLDDGGLLIPYTVGTQVGFTSTVRAGYLVFDDNGKPVKRFNRQGRGQFITTESALSSQLANLANFKIEAIQLDATAVETIPAYHVVAYTDVGEISPASQLTPEIPAIGIVTEDMTAGEVRTFISAGYITNYAWNWTDAPGQRLFVGTDGVITTSVPQNISIQQIGKVVSPDTIFVDINPVIFLV